MPDVTDPDVAAAWDELHDANDQLGWFVGRPGQRHGGQWAMYAFDAKEKVHFGRRSREWTAVGQTEPECIREMARVSETDQRGTCAEVIAYCPAVREISSST